MGVVVVDSIYIFLLKKGGKGFGLNDDILEGEMFEFVFVKGEILYVYFDLVFVI